MVKINKKDRYWFSLDKKEDLIRDVEDYAMLYFEYKGRDYVVEHYVEGYLIADPIPYYLDGGFPEHLEFQYPMTFQAKTPKELLELPFLDGKTMLEEFDKLRFWEWCADDMPDRNEID